jgi:hypothetical protein
MLKRQKVLSWSGAAFFLIIGLCILGLGIARSNLPVKKFLLALQQNRIEKIEVINCSVKGFMILEVDSTQPAMHFHKWAKQAGDLQSCNVSVFGKENRDNYIDGNKAKVVFSKLDALRHYLDNTKFIWNPLPHNIVMDGIYFYEKNDSKVYAIYFAQHSYGAIATWRYSEGVWTLEDLKNTYNENFYDETKKLFMPQ